jgi:ADP-ribose pyrophosphatase YjhB (NUDIX family)
LTREKKRRNIAAGQESKHCAITPEVVGEFARMWGNGNLAVDLTELAAELAAEHKIFANAKSAAELENNAPQTVVGIGEYKRGRQRGFVLVYNEAKRGLGFPGGRVRFGQSPEARLIQEMAEETNLVCEVISPPVSEHPVGEEEHRFTAFEVRFIGGRPMARPTKDEPITAVVFIDGGILLDICRTGGLIKVKGLPEPVGILASHRRVFLEFASKRKEAADV